MTIEELPEVRLAQPTVNAWTHLDADGLGNVRRISHALCQIRLAEPTLADQPFGAVLKVRLRAFDDLSGHEQWVRGQRRNVD